MEIKEQADISVEEFTARLGRILSLDLDGAEHTGDDGCPTCDAKLIILNAVARMIENDYVSAEGSLTAVEVLLGLLDVPVDSLYVSAYVLQMRQMRAAGVTVPDGVDGA